MSKFLNLRNKIFLSFFSRRDETFSEDINQTTDGLSISRKYASTSALSTNSPQVSFIRDPREDNRLLNYARSSSSYSIPMLPNDHIRLPVELSNMMRGHSSFNLRIREYDLSINSNTLKPGLHLAHSYDSIIDSEFKAPLPPPQLNKRQHRSRAIEAPKYQENSSHSSHLRQQSAPPLFHEKSSSVSIEKRQKISIDLSKKSESSKNVKNSTKLTEELTKKLPGSTKLLDDVSENNTLNSKIDAKSSSSCSSKVKADPPVPEKKSQQTKNVKANEKLKTPKMPSCKAPTKTQSSHAAKETPSKLPDKPKEKEPACGANKNNQKTLKGSTNSSQKKTTVMTKAETHEAKSKDPEKIPGSLDPADLITLADVSSAGSSLTTDDDDEWVSGGISRYKERHLSHRIKKLHKRRNEIREKSSELKKKEKSHDTEKELKSKNPPKNESDFSMDKNEMLKETKKDVTVRVEERKKAENRKKFDKVDKKKPDERAKNKKKVYEYYDTDSSD